MLDRRVTLDVEHLKIAAHIAKMTKLDNIQDAVGFSLAFTEEILYRLQEDEGSSLLIRSLDGKAVELHITIEGTSVSKREGSHGYH